MAGPMYLYDINNPGGSTGAGDVKNVTTSYDTSSGLFNWSHTIGQTGSGALSDAFWLVVSPGANPKGNNTELAIIYGDLDSNRMSVYQYNGKNSANSYKTESLLASVNNAFNVSDNAGNRTVSFSFDASGINGAGCDYPAVNNPGNDMDKGICFGQKVGIWFHPSAGSSFSYDNMGGIASYSYSSQSWYDTANRVTTEVSEPGIVGLLSAGLFGLMFARRKA